VTDADAPTEGSDVFISYSRADRDFVGRLSEAMAARGRSLWVDWEGIPPTAEWMAEIREAIDAADTFVVVMSPDSVRSQVCSEELAHAIEANKRIVPIVAREVEPASVPPELAKLNWLFARESDDFERAVEQLVEALDTDLDQVKFHTRLLVRAREWEQTGKVASKLLRGGDLTDAERWLGSPGRGVTPTAQQAAYVVASRRAATGRQRRLVAGVSLALVIALVLGALAFVQRRSAIEQRDLARTQAAASAAISELDHDPETSLLLALEAAKTGRTQLVEEALRRSILASNVAQVLRGHVNEVDDIGFLPDGTTLISAGTDNTIRSWDTSSGEQIALRSIPAAGQTIDLDVDPAGEALALATTNGEVVILDTGTLDTIRVIHLASVVFSAEYSPDGKMLATTSADGGVRIFDAASGKLEHEFPPLSGGAYYADFSPDGASLAVASGDTDVHVYDVASGDEQLVLQGHSGLVFRSVYSPDGALILTASEDHTARVFDAETGDQLRLFAHTTLVQDAAWALGGSAVVTVDSQGVGRIWDLTTGEPISELLGHRDWITYVAVAPDGRVIATSSLDATIRVWRPGPGFAVTQVDADAPVMGAAFNLDGSRFAIGGNDGSAVYDALSGERVMELGSGRDAAPAYSSDGSLVATAGYTPDGGSALRLWDASTGGLVSTVVFGSNTVTSDHAAPARETPYEIAFSPDSTKVAVALDVGTRVYDVASGQEVAAYASEPQPLSTPGLAHLQGVAFSPNGRLIALSDGIDAVLWDPDRDVVFRRFAPALGTVYDVRFSPDGRWLLIASADNAATLWDVRTGGELVTYTGHQGVVYTAAFSPDGRFVVTAANDGTARVWTVAGTQIEEFRPATLFVSSATFMPDGSRILVTTGEGLTFAPAGVPLPDQHSGAVKLYTCEVCTSFEGLIGLAGERVTRTLTAAERNRFLSSAAAPQVPSPSPEASPTISAPLVGTYTVEIADSDMTDPRLAFAVGTWTVRFLPNGEFSIWNGELSARSGNPAIRGFYELEGETLSIGPSWCGPRPGSYQWSLSGGLLALTPVEDKCPPRMLVLGTRPLEAQT
jgi:WD40 repeat protein